MESQGLSRKDLENCIGSRARVSEILNHKRTLTLAMIKKLYAKFKIPATVLIQGTYRKSIHLAIGQGNRI